VFYQRVHIVRISDVRAGFVVPASATEVRLVETPEALDDIVDLVRVSKELAGGRTLTAFSLADLEERAAAAGSDVRLVLAQLSAAGVSDLADVPVDRLDDVAASIGRAREAGLRTRRLTVQNPVADRKTEVLDRIRICVGSVGGITHVSPLPQQPAHDRPTTGYDDVRLVALTRLAIGNMPPVPFIAVDWQRYGPKLAQVALTFGADFLDAVPATTDETLGKRRDTVADVERNIRAAGFEPQEYRP
jgi:aminodeoxyfutalosine synthase